MPSNVDELKTIIDEFKKAAPYMNSDDHFAAFLCHAKAAEDTKDALGHVVGQANDGGIDAYYVDDALEVAFVIQVKYRQTQKVRESKKDVVDAFADRLTRLITVPNHNAYLSAERARLNPTAKMALDRVRQAHDDGYIINLVYATTGTIPTRVAEAAHTLVDSSDRCFFEAIDQSSLGIIVDDYLDGIAPAIAQIPLVINEPRIKLRSMEPATVTTTLMWVAADVIADLFTTYDRRLFDLNIRGFLAGKVSELIGNSVIQEPEAFIYLNNGITIICEKVSIRDHHGREALILSKPQIVNGQQTTRSLHAAAATNRRQVERARVMVKIVEVPRTSMNRLEFMDTVRSIVAGANTQIAISPRDLVSNDRRQILLGRGLAALGYIYLRKRMHKDEVVQIHRGDPRKRIKLDLVVQVLGASETENYIGTIGPSVTLDISNTKHSYQEMFRDEVTGLTVAIRISLNGHIRKIIRKPHNKPEKPHNKAQWPMLYVAWSDLNSHIDNRVPVLKALELLDWKDTNTPFDDAMAAYLKELMRQFDSYRRSYEASVRDPIEISPWMRQHFKLADFRRWQRAGMYRGETHAARAKERVDAVKRTTPKT